MNQYTRPCLLRKTAGHPVIASAEPGERWLYCYQHDQTVDY